MPYRQARVLRYRCHQTTVGGCRCRKRLIWHHSLLDRLLADVASPMVAWATDNDGCALLMCDVEGDCNGSSAGDQKVSTSDERTTTTRTRSSPSEPSGARRPSTTSKLARIVRWGLPWICGVHGAASQAQRVASRARTATDRHARGVNVASATDGLPTHWPAANATWSHQVRACAATCVDCAIKPRSPAMRHKWSELRGEPV
jgi:hypothetical protein